MEWNGINLIVIGMTSNSEQNKNQHFAQSLGVVVVEASLLLTNLNAKPATAIKLTCLPPRGNVWFSLFLSLSLTLSA